MKRAEHDFYKLIARTLKKLPDDPVKKELVALVDGYFLTVSNKTRESDFNIDEEIKRSLIGGE